DSTGSMQPYFGSAAQAVQTITEYLGREYGKGSERPDIRYSVVFYRDYIDEGRPNGKPQPGDPPVTYLVKRLPLTGNVEAVVRFLEEEKNALCNGCGGDEPEAVFHGIDYAISSAANEVRNGLRAIVLIGDKGNHPIDER